MDSQSSSPAVQASRKRPAKVIVSDDEEDDVDQLNSTPAAVNGKGKSRASAQRKRVRSSSSISSVGGSDLDILGSGEEEEAPAKRKKGKEKANGIGRQNGNGHAGDSDEDGDEEAGPSVRRGEIGFRPEYKRGKDGYVAGSIVRIKLINFMTYDQVEFRPGPHLNMILGPNGTGKSTIAASIAIGLGFPPKIMGRASDLKAYVKQGCEEAQIEVELKAFPRKKNPVIWRSFTKENEKSEWRLNGTKSTKQAIAEIVAEFGVQANNLCCFLAQDKVAEFAKMDGTVVLKETMRAAGDPRLSAWHEKLIELGAARKTIETELESKTAERNTVQEKVNNLAPDVQHFEERAGLKTQEKVLRCLVLASKRFGLLRQLASHKEELSQGKKDKNQLLEMAQPTQELRKLYTTKVDKAAARVNEADKAVREADRKLKTTWLRLTNKEEAVQSIATSLANIKKEMKRDAELRTNFQKQVRDAQAILDRPVEDVTAQLDQLDVEKRRVASQMHTAKKAVQELSAKHRQSENQLSTWNRELQIKTEQHTKLNSIQTQKEQAACNFDPSIRYVLDWLKQHENEFEEPICKPPMISVNINDARYAWQVESCTNLGDRSTFICQTRNDYARLLALNKHSHPGYPFQKRDGSQGYHQPGRVKLYISQVTVNEETCNPRRACSPEQLKVLGFDGWGSDYVEAEAPVIAFLNNRCNLATTAVTLKRSDQIRHDHVLAARITNYVTASEIVRVTYSKYGNKDPVTKSDPPRPAVAFNLAVNTEKVNELVEEMTVLKRNKRDIEAPLENERIEKEKAEEKVGELFEEHANLKKEEGKLREGNLARIRAGENLQRAQQDLVKLGNIDYDQKRANLQAKQKNNLADRVTIIKDMNAVEEGYIDLTSVAAKRTLELHQFTEDLRAIDAQIEDSESAIKEVDELIGQRTVAITSFKAQIQEIVTMLKEQLGRLGENSHLATDQLEDVAPMDNERQPTRTHDELRDELADVRARLDLTEGIDEAVITRYKKLKAELETLVATTEQQAKNAATVNSKIQKILDQFDPALDTLVGVVNQKFSAAFEFVGCAGEIRVNRADEGFDKWGIDILVSYRDGDKLDVLTGTRQSGGERSLATITYLMSLSSMARTPFSLVDEINQGMDQRAERNVHNQLVDVTCTQEAGQYFLITPKLLTDLTYHRKMKILNVNNGSWLPVPKPSSGRALKWSDFKGCLSSYRASKGITAGA